MTTFSRTALALIAPFALIACDGDSKSAATPDAAATPAAAPGSTAATDWTKTVVETPEGGFRMGNPDAKVKIVEFASFTCTHCKDFHLEAEKNLKPTYVKTGQVSYEYRPFMLNVYDFVAAQVALCEGSDRFFTWAGELYGNHDAWVTPFTKLTEADIAPLKALAPGEQVKGLAVAGKMHEFARSRGMPRAQFDTCLSNQAQLDKLTAQQQAAIDAYQINGTPSFLLNGRKLDGVNSWETLKPRIDEAL